jgi:hypothetical protein
VYILCKHNRSTWDRPIAAFYVIPYFTRRSLAISNLSELLDIYAAQIWQIEETRHSDPEDMLIEGIEDNDANEEE